MRHWGGFRITDFSDPEQIRRAFFDVDVFLRQLSTAVGSSVEPGQNPSASMTLPTVTENDAISNSTKGLLVFGRGDDDDLAHALPTHETGNFAQNFTRPDRIALAGAYLLAKRENRAGSQPNYWSQLCSRHFIDTVLGTDSSDSAADGDVGLITADCCFRARRILDDLDGKYYTGGGGVGQQRDLSFDGNFDSGTLIGAHQCRKGVLWFAAKKLGTPPGTLRIFLIGANTETASNAGVLREWTFTDDDWIPDATYPFQVLRFDVEMPFFWFRVIATGSPDSSNYFEIDNCEVWLRT